MKKVLLWSILWICSCSSLLWAQERQVTGTVTSGEDGSYLPGVNVVLKGTNTGTTTDTKGSYKISVPSGGSLTFSFIGFKTQDVIVGNKSVVDIGLVPDFQQLGEVVITTAGGFQTKTKELGTAASVVTSQVLTAGKAVNIASGLQGKVAGFQISGTSSGVNPEYRLVLRGQRSLTGNNQALVVLDNVIVPSTVLSNLNPNDVDQVVILNGSGAAALYGSQASNGAVLITTKRGKNGRTEISVSQTVQAQQVAFLPKIQKKFGAGGSAYGINGVGSPTYSYLENQSYGPAFDGVVRPIGSPLEDGSQDSTAYSYKNGHDKFWNVGLTSQTDFSLTSGDDKSSLYVSGQFIKTQGTTPGDKFNRANVRVNGSRKIGKIVNVSYSTSFAPNRYDITSQTGSIYSSMLNMPSNVDITKYKNWRTDKFANPNGFYNPWYLNPYFVAETNREIDKNDYLTGNLEIKITPIKGLDLIARQGISSRYFSNKYTTEGFTYTDYAKNTESSSKSDIPSSVTETNNNTTQLLTDVLAQFNKTVGIFNFNLIAGGQLTQNDAKYLTTGISGLVVKDLYNLSNGTGSPSYAEADFRTRQVGAYGKLTVGFKDFLFLNATGRNDWDSRLAVNNRSFFYPSVDLSFVASEAIPLIHQSKVINYLKLRGGLSKVGQVNLGNGSDPNNFGAYQLLPTFSSNTSYGTANGFPYGSLAGYSLSNTLVSNNLKPEITKGYEVGFDLNLLDDRITTNVTWYDTKTTNQTVTTSLSNSTGFSNLLTNVGQTQSKGLELSLHVTPVRTEHWNVTVGGNYTYLKNTVNYISADLPTLTLSTSGNAISSAVAGMSFPVIMGYDYVRDPQGHVIVNSSTGLPTQTENLQVLGNATPKNRVGMDANISYKSLRLSVLFEYRGGYKVFNGIGTEMDWSGTGYRTAVYNRESFVFPNSVYQAADGTYVENKTISIANGNGNNGFWSDGINRNVTSNYVTSGNFIKLREISLSYSLPSSLLNKTHFIKDVTISAQGRNLFLWMAKDNLYTDPEYSSAGAGNNGGGLNSLNQTPPTRYFGGTVAFKF